MLDVVVPVVVALLVVFSMLICIIRFLVQVGTLVLPYHLNYMRFFIVIIFIKLQVLIISLVVAIHIMVTHVELSLFIHFILIQLLIGLLVLLYHLNQ
jgi:hypothetical protein